MNTPVKALLFRSGNLYPSTFAIANILFLGLAYPTLASAESLERSTTPNNITPLHQRLFWTSAERDLFEHYLHESLNPKRGTSSPTKSKPTPPNAPSNIEHFLAASPPLSTEAMHHEQLFTPSGATGGTPTPDYPILSNPNANQRPIDHDTASVNESTYHATFSPSVVPYKRLVSHNRIQVAPTLVTQIDPDPYQPVQPLDPQSADKRRKSYAIFWGSLLLSFSSSFAVANPGDSSLRPAKGLDTSPGPEWIPIPSVAPTQELLTIITEPPDADIHFIRDKAGNFYAYSELPGLIRLQIEIAVDPFTFNGPLTEPGEKPLSWQELDAAAEDQDLVSRLPAPFQKEALKTLSQLGISRTTSPAITLQRLVGLFRNFEAKQSGSYPTPPIHSNNSGLDTFRNMIGEKLGVCRHRSTLFVTAATVLGIPSHFVNNEAHAFVEVFWPSRHDLSKPRWRRIELGGAANHMSFTNLDGKPIHQPHDSSFEEPEPFLANQIEIQSNSPPTAPTADAHATKPHTNVREDNLVNADESPANQAANPQRSATTLSGGLADHADRREYPKLTIERYTASVRRGDTTRILVRLWSGDQPIVRRKVSLYLQSATDRKRANVLLLGTETTNGLGEATIAVTIPKAVPAGRWTLFARFDGDGSFPPVDSE